MALKPPVEVPQGAIRLNTDSQKLEFFAQDQWWEMATSAALTTGSGRAVFGGSYNYPGNCVDVIDYIQISTQGDAIDFGNLTQSQGTGTSFGSVTRAIWAGGATNGGGTSNGTRGIFGGGAGAAYTNTIQYITISTTGNAEDFGDLTVARILYSATSDSHGGLS